MLISAGWYNAIIIGLFMWFLVAGHTAGSFNRPDGVQLYSILVLKLIGASIVFGIVLAVAMAIVWRIVTGKGPEVMRDERDRTISGIGWKVSMLGSAIGFVGGIIALALGAEVIFALNLMVAGCAFGDTGGNLAKLYAYRRGV